jgi:flagellar biogenesis protein FliO
MTLSAYRLSLQAAVVAVALGASAAQAKTMALAGGAAQTDIPWLRLTGALILCLALAVAAALALRTRLGGGSPSGLKLGLADFLGARGALAGRDARRLQLVETLRLSHNIDVCVLRFDDRDVLVAATAQGVVQLSPPPAEPDSARQ